MGEAFVMHPSGWGKSSAGLDSEACGLDVPCTTHGPSNGTACSMHADVQTMHIAQMTVRLRGLWGVLGCRGFWASGC